MSATRTAQQALPTIDTRQVAHEIGLDCDRALRRLDRLIGERDDVVLLHARTFIQHAARLSETIECEGVA